MSQTVPFDLFIMKEREREGKYRKRKSNWNFFLPTQLLHRLSYHFADNHVDFLVLN